MKKLKKIYWPLALSIVVLAAVYLIYVHNPNKQVNQPDQIDVLSEATMLYNDGDKEGSISLLESRVDSCGECSLEKERLLTYYFKEKRYDEFVQKFSSEVEESASLCNMRAYVAMNDGNDAEAIKYYEKAIEQSPGTASYYINYATFQMNFTQDKKLSIEILKKGIEVIPGSKELLLVAAKFSKDLNDLEGAKSFASSVLEFDPTNQEAKKLLNL